MEQNIKLGEDRTLPVFDAEGAKTKATVVLPGSIFDVALNIPLIHQVVEAQRAAARQGTHATKTRAEVSGGGKKPWRQKGTGRARQGSIRAPQWKGGGVVHGPQPRDYSQRTPKKMIAGALRSALSDRARTDAIYVFSALVSSDVPSTKAAIATLAAVTDAKKVLIVIDRDQDLAEVTARSFKNIEGVHIVWADQLNTYDVVDSDRVVFTEAALNSYVERVNNARARVGAGVEKEDDK
ncbi:50S ribosomal protein L4 [Actinomyces minihominis]|uniref:50S ribosomal protein L4 n=1 Tax=Actinomyces minihominis TaxID=2002838 RepID=UPI000C076CFB|nr:50S ribosomal protein L4 [Actinomyces minihominis]